MWSLARLEMGCRIWIVTLTNKGILTPEELAAAFTEDGAAASRKGCIREPPARGAASCRVLPAPHCRRRCALQASRDSRRQRRVNVAPARQIGGFSRRRENSGDFSPFCLTSPNFAQYKSSKLCNPARIRQS